MKNEPADDALYAPLRLRFNSEPSTAKGTRKSTLISPKLNSRSSASAGQSFASLTVCFVLGIGLGGFGWTYRQDLKQLALKADRYFRPTPSEIVRGDSDPNSDSATEDRIASTTNDSVYGHTALRPTDEASGELSSQIGSPVVPATVSHQGHAQVLPAAYVVPESPKRRSSSDAASSSATADTTFSISDLELPPLLDRLMDESQTAQ